MKISKFNRKDCLEARGLVIVIDVIRAFTTSAYAFAAGAERIILVSTIEEAFYLREKNPHYLLMGEVNGHQVDGFDFGNSPSQFLEANLTGRTLVQRTSSGTQGVVAAVNAGQILTGSFVIAQATLERIRNLKPDQVSFIITGQHDGSEDLAFAEYLESSLLGQAPDPNDYLKKVQDSPGARRSLANPNDHCCSRADLAEVLRLDQYAFATEVVRERDGLTMRPVCATGERWRESRR